MAVAVVVVTLLVVVVVLVSVLTPHNNPIVSVRVSNYRITRFRYRMQAKCVYFQINPSEYTIVIDYCLSYKPYVCIRGRRSIKRK